MSDTEEEPAEPKIPIAASEGWTGTLAASIIATKNVAGDGEEIEGIFIIAIRRGQTQMDFGTALVDDPGMQWWAAFSQVTEQIVRKLNTAPKAAETLGARAAFKAHERAASRDGMPAPGKRLVHYATCPRSINPNAPICACDGDAAPLLVPRSAVER